MATNMQSVNQILAGTGGDFGRQTKYRVLFPLPDEISKLVPRMGQQQIDVLAKGVIIPEIKNEPIEMKYMGHDLAIFGRSNFDLNFSITFYNDEKNELRKLFYKWIVALDNGSYDRSTENNKDKEDSGFWDKVTSVDPFSDFKEGATYGNVGTNKYTSYTTEIQIQATDFEDELSKAIYSFEGVYPISVETIQYDSTAVSQIQEFTVQFKYFRYSVDLGGGIIDAGYNFIDRVAGDVSQGIDSWLGKGTPDSSAPDLENIEGDRLKQILNKGSL